MTRTQVTLLTAGDPDRVTGGYLFHRRVAERAARHDAQLSFVSIPDLPLPWAMAAGPAWLRDRALETADVVVLDSIAAAAAAPWLRWVDAPMAGMLHQPLGGMEGAHVVRRVRAPFDRWAYRRTRLLMVASDWLAEQLVAAGVPRAMLRVVAPGKNVEAEADAGESLSRSRDELRDGRRIAGLCVANWLSRKGIMELLDAVAQLPDDVLTLHLVGDAATPGAYAGRVRRRLARADLRDRVVVHGVIPPPAVHRLYRTTDAFLLPSFEEPYGTVWGEAMAAGLPVVGWRAGNLPFLADHEREALMVPAGDVAALGAAIERLARTPTLRARMGRAAAARAAGRPTWDETARRFFEIIAEVRAHAGARRDV